LTAAQSMGPIGIFGGTFDPIHYGHLRTALELEQTLGLARVHFVPCASPPHRDAPMTDGRLRLKLVKAAIHGERKFVADDRELERAGPSYTVDTLASFRAEFPRRSLCLLVGMDAFLGLPKWHRWRELLSLAHIVVAHRPGWRAPTTGTLGKLLEERRASRAADLRRSAAGRMYVQPVTQLEISSTDLRAALVAGLDPKFLMPDSVRKIILKTECYAENP
jgi:nicotinate-nucleotide adenylyltransferase